jgi:integrase/recombinase XerC
MTIKLIEDFINYKLSLNRKSVEQYRVPLYHFAEFLSENGTKKVTGLSLINVNKKVAQAYIIGLKSNKSYASVVKARTVLKAFYNYLNMEGRVDSNPFKETQIPYDMKERSRVKDTIESDEASLLVAQADNNQDKLKLLLMAVMGFRKTEVVNLKVSDINVGDMTINFLRKGHGNLRQELPIFKSVQESLVEHYNFAKSQGWTYMFESPVKRGKPITLMAVTNLFNKCQLKAGLDGKAISPHKLRATAITNIYEKTDLLTAQVFANHQSIQTTAGYIKKSNLVDALRDM